MEETKIEILKNTKLDNFESHQDYIENDASDYESINSDNEESNGKQDNSDYESDTLQNTKRQEGDGQESIPPKKVDDDEDKKNPQYIPKRGTFYEHDDRTLDEEENEETTIDKKERQSKKSIWIEKKERWGHDRFNENEQAPKSRTELIGIYGYDIRNEEGAPRARRRRRYGRGPNKYTRTWEDEDAYKPAKPIKTFTKKTKDTEDLTASESQSENNDDEIVEEPSKPVTNQIKISSNNNSIPKTIVIQPKIIKDKPTEPKNNAVNTVKVQEKEIKPVEYRTFTKVLANVHEKPADFHSFSKVQEKEVKPADFRTTKVQEVKPTDYRGFTKVRQYKNSQIQQKVLKRQENVETLNNLDEDLANLALTKRQNRQSIPPRLQNEQKGSKRYSSLRQRSLPETAATTTFNQQTYYANDYTPPQPQQAILSQPPPATVLQQIPPMQQVPVTATALLPTPTQFAPPFPPPPGFLPAAVQPSPFIQPQTQIINYVPSQPQFTQAPFQGFPHQQFTPVTPTAELNYQCQGGTTYYSTQNQQLGLVPLQRRPKAAIPILPPPPRVALLGVDRSNNMSGVSSHDEDELTEYENYYEDNYEDPNIIVQ